MFLTIDVISMLGLTMGLSTDKILLIVSACIVIVTLSCFGSRPNISFNELILIPVTLDIKSHRFFM